MIQHLDGNKFTIFCFMARSQGLICFERLAMDPRFEIIGLYTHKFNPRSQDPLHGVRNDWELWRYSADRNSVLLKTSDDPTDTIQVPECDLIVSVNWRYMISRDILNKARLGAINVHRGLLPDYAGASPIRRHLAAGLMFTTITAHIMTEKIDNGPILSFANFPACVYSGETLDEAESRERFELEPYMPKVMISAIEKLINFAELKDESNELRRAPWNRVSSR